MPAFMRPSFVILDLSNKGIRANTVVSTAALVLTSSLPPTDATRSRIPSSPSRPGGGQLIAVSASKPMPSSSTMATACLLRRSR